jgi:hypothetical protein
MLGFSSKISGAVTPRFNQLRPTCRLLRWEPEDPWLNPTVPL